MIFTRNLSQNSFMSVYFIGYVTKFIALFDNKYD